MAGLSRSTQRADRLHRITTSGEGANETPRRRRFLHLAAGAVALPPVPHWEDAMKSALLPSLCLFMLITWPAIAGPLDDLEGNKTIRLAEEQIICPQRGNRSCRTITRNVKPGCRRASTGGLGRGNSFKLVCA